MGWLLGDKILRMGVGLIVGVWVARYLGPEQFGHMNYAMAIVGLFGAVSGLGLNGIVVRDLVKEPDGAGVTLGTAFVLQLIGGCLAFVFSVAAEMILQPEDLLGRMMVAIFGVALIFKASEVVKYWFESQVKAKYSVWAENGAFLLLAAIRAGLVFLKAPLLAFVLASFAETMLAAILLFLIYSNRVKRLTSWRLSITRAKALLSESWPLILSAVASMINMRVDQVILGAKLDNSTVGNYAAAVRLAEVWLLVPAVIGSSVYPAIIGAKGQGEVVYRQKIQMIVKLMSLWVLPTALIISFFSGGIVHLVYGHEYTSAGSYLMIYIWTGVPYLIFFVLNQMLYIEGLLRFGFWVSVFSVASNLLLNFLLIPQFGGTGAALATLVTTVASMLITLSVLVAKTGIFLRFGK